MLTNTTIAVLLLASCIRLWSGVSAQTWAGYQSQTALTAPLSSPTGYSVVSLAVDATVNSATDAVLLLVNINVASNAASYQMAFTIFRGGLDLSTTGHVMAEIGPTTSSTESMPMTFSFRDVPGSAGTFTYTVYAMYSATISLSGQTRQIGALSIPSSMASNSATVYNEMDYVTPALQPITGLSAQITPPTTNHVVLVSVTFSIYPFSTNTVVTVSLLRYGVPIDTNAMQRVSAIDGSRLCTIFYVDKPNSVGAVTYSVSAAMPQGSKFTVCKDSKSIAKINLVALPGSTVASVSSEVAQTISVSSWTSVGLQVTVIPVSTTDKVLVTVNLNVCPTVATATAVFTIFRNGGNLGGTTNGLQRVTVGADGLFAPVSMSYLDSPNSAGVGVMYTVYALMYGTGSYVISANGQTRQIAAIVTNAGTIAPTLAPVSTPTAVPTVAPVAITPGYAYTQGSLPPLFEMRFGLKLPPFTSLNLNIWDLRDQSTGNTILLLDRYNNYDLRLKYDGQLVATLSIDTTSVGVSPTTTTLFTISMGYNTITWSSSLSPTVQTVSITKTGTPTAYTLYVSNPASSSGGTFSQFSLTGLSGAPSALPTSQPSRQPSSQPSRQPSSQPSRQPSSRPSGQPSSQPSMRPSGQPSRRPSGQPSAQPSSRPSTKPSSQPSVRPSGQPSARPSGQPSRRPSGQPSAQPSSRPSTKPSSQPSAQPTSQPGARPTNQPSVQPSSQPTGQPVSSPSAFPTGQPSSRPSSPPSTQPSTQPSQQPSARPTAQPSMQPTSQPSCQPVDEPTIQPSRQPSSQPSARPSAQPSEHPSAQPSSAPSVQPTQQPSSRPSGQPSSRPSRQPSSQPTSQPSAHPSARPASAPSCAPSAQPTAEPSNAPSGQPIAVPTGQPTSVPSCQPTIRTSGQPSAMPSTQPSSRPSAQPSAQPTGIPSQQPSSQPSTRPSCQPSTQPSTQPSAQPSAAPSTQPSARPSAQPLSQPSGVPTSQPSVEPSVQPSGQPTSLPSAPYTSVPSSQPSAKPSAVPSVQPSTQPTQRPSAQPVGHPSSSPSTQPSALPSTQPTATPTDQPSNQPTIQLSGQPVSSPTTKPSTQPSSQPTSRPSVAPTGEWATVVSHTSLLTKVSYPDDHVWACGKQVDTNTALCSLATVATGEVIAQYQFAWDSVLSVLNTNTPQSVVLTGRAVSTMPIISDVATCNTNQAQIHCVVRSFRDTSFTGASFAPLPNVVVYVGMYNVYTSVTLLYLTTNTIHSYIYSAFNMKELKLSQVQSPPYFIGSFVAGTAVRATASPANYIVAGMVRTDGGILNAMILMPQSGEIVTTTELVNAMALEVLGPDSFIAGGLQLDDGIGMHAYLLRTNALFMSIQYCVRYRSTASGGRRVLTTSTTTSSVVKGIELVGGNMFLIIDCTRDNITSLSVIKSNVVNGDIIKQVHVTAPNGTSLTCTDIASATTFLSIICYTRGNTSQLQSLLFSVDQDLTFGVLPEGYTRSEQDAFREENIPFKRTVLTVTKSNTVVGTSDYEFSTDDSSPTRRPSLAPSTVPSEQPSSAPSAQPTSSPTAVPSTSARPTSEPSTSGPTNTYRPTVEPSVAPTRKPSSSPTTKPSILSTSTPTTRPTTMSPSPKPTSTPSAVKTLAPRSTPSVKPTCNPTVRPAVVNTAAPSVPTLQPTAVVDSGRSRLPPYVVGASVGGGLGMLLIGYLLYRYYDDLEENNARDRRKVEYFRQQTLLAEQARAETAKYIEKENQRNAAEKAEKAHRKAARQAARQRTKARARTSSHGSSDGGGTIERPRTSSYGTVHELFLSSSSSSAKSSSYAISSLNSSERRALRRSTPHRKRNKGAKQVLRDDNSSSGDSNHSGSVNIDSGSSVDIEDREDIEDGEDSGASRSEEDDEGGGGSYTEEYSDSSLPSSDNDSNDNDGSSIGTESDGSRHTTGGLHQSIRPDK